MSKKVSIKYSNIRQLAMHLCNQDIDTDDVTLEYALVGKFDVDLESFCSLTEYFLPLIKVQVSDNDVSIGFGNNSEWFVRTSAQVAQTALL